MTLAEFERVVRVNLAGTFLCMKHELPLLKGGGAIVNVASNGGLYAIARAAAYVAAKHGIVGLTKVAAAVVWLCSDAASYVTGIALSIDGGRRA